jgi:hypothetical protein
MANARWIAEAQAKLLQARPAGRAWGYRKEDEPRSEPTALAGLALLAAGQEEGRKAAAAAAAWLAQLQQPDGAVGVSATLPRPAWPTPLALLLWKALDDHAEESRRAADWLLQAQGSHFVRKPDDPLQHDTSIPGWPWVEQTHSWVEPTALAILSLRRSGQGSHQRVADGLRMIRNRALPSGGWNYGNTITFGSELRPQPAPTGLALLALAGVDPPGPLSERGSDYLTRTLPSVRAPLSLGWGVLGLRAWGRSPAAVAAWLEEAHAAVDRHGSQNLHRAILLLAGSEISLSLLGLAEERVP